MTIANPFQIPMREPLVDARTGLLSRPWYLFLQNLINLAQPDSGVNVDDLAVQQLFDNDNTSEVAAVQKQIDEIVIDINDSSTGLFDTTGTVRYVNATAPSGVLGVSGVPYQNSGTLALAWSGTSGGIPYFSSTTGMASSALLTNHGVIVGGGAAATPATISVGTNNQFLAGNTGANPGFRAIVAASADFVNQGTTTTVLHGNAAGNPSWAAVDLVNDTTGTLTVAKGGTSLTTLTAHAVYVGNGTSAPTALALGSAGEVLTSNGAGADPSFQPVTATTVPSWVLAFAAAHG